MPLSPEEKQKFEKWLEINWVGKKECPICNNDRWGIPEKVFGMIEFNGKNIIIGGSVQPIISLVCDKCGYTISFNAIKGGIVKKVLIPPKKNGET